MRKNYCLREDTVSLKEYLTLDSTVSIISDTILKISLDFLPPKM
jgi:hypothetical protein